MGKTGSTYRRIVPVLLLFWWATLHYMMLIPPFEGSDEREHFGYVTHMRSGAFPNPDESMTNLATQASAQGPFHYTMVYLWSQLAPDYHWDGVLPDNPWRSYVRPLPGNDNPNYTLFGPDQIPYADNPNIGDTLIWLRMVSAFEGLLTIALAYATACLLLPRKWALFTTIMVAFNSVLVQIFALLTNDASAILFGTFSAYWIAVLVRRDLKPRTLIYTGIVVGLGTLTKLSVLVFAPVAGVIVLLRLWPDWKAVIRKGIMLALPVALIGGPWFLYQGIAYGDPLGIEPHLRMNWAHIPPRTLLQAYQEDGITPLVTLWSGYAWALLTTQPWVYGFNLILLALSLIGYGRAFRRLWRDQKLVIIALGLIWAAVFAAYLRWWTMFTFMNGRHLLPGYPALMILVALGLLYGWRDRIGYLMRMAFGSLTVFVAVIVVGNVILVEAFKTITFPPEQEPPLEGQPLQFDEVAFLGYQIEPEPLQVGEPIHVKTCWASLREEDRLAVPNAFAFHLVDENDIIVAGRESYTGMGKYTNWLPNQAFCDHYDLEMKQDLIPARAYRVVVAMFDPETVASVPEDTGNGPFIGWVSVPGPELSAADQAAAPYHFDGIDLLDYQLTRNESGFTLQMQWGTGEWQARSVTLFIHAINPDGSTVGQADIPLGENSYPSFLWGQNERTFAQTYTVDVSSDDYTVYIGLYDPTTLDRLPVMDSAGNALPDGRAPLRY